jgi:DNA-binding MurR/RpiR family transcriptional regulator|tara:strand:+ start:6265 stop:7149 length:885 start_codon:yes stop_codon:yes gene_type:complete
MFDLIQRVNAYRKNMTPAQISLADTLLLDLGAAAHLTIAELAERAGVSSATITRFCETLDYSGYADLKAAIVVALDRKRSNSEKFAIAEGDVTESDSIDETLYKISHQAAEAITDTARIVDRAALDIAAAAVINCRRLDIYGLGSSFLAATDLQLKLHRIGLTAFCWSDTHLALTSAAVLTDKDVAIAISHSGVTSETFQMMETAKKAGAIIIAITNHPASPMGRLADHVLVTSAKESRFRSGAMTSRLVQLAMVDFLFVRIMQQIFGSASASLEKTFTAVKNNRLNYNQKLND